MEVRVDLPPGSLIDPLGFCKAIARAIHPAGEQGLEGIECFDGKIVTHHVPMPQPAGDRAGSVPGGLQSVLISDDCRPLDQLFGDHDDGAKQGEVQLPLTESIHRGIMELPLPYKLTDDDRRALENVLRQLPPLRYPMSEAEAAAFMDAYFALSDRPAWEPVLVTSGTIEQLKEQQGMVMRQHLQALREEVASGRLVAVDNNHVPVAALSIGSYLPREQAIAYLDRHGIEHRDQESGGDQRVVEPPQTEAHPERSNGKVGTVAESKLSDKQREQLVEHYRRLKKRGAKDYSKQTAEKFGVSDRTVRYAVNEANAEAEAKVIPSIAQSLISANKKK